MSYQSERFSSKWELPFLPPSSLEVWRKERARKAALILMKISHFDRTLRYRFGNKCGPEKNLKREYHSHFKSDFNINIFFSLFLLIISDWCLFDYSTPRVEPLHVNNDQNGIHCCCRCNYHWQSVHQSLGQNVRVFLLWKVSNSCLYSVVSLDNVEAW